MTIFLHGAWAQVMDFMSCSFKDSKADHCFDSLYVLYLVNTIWKQNMIEFGFYFYPKINLQSVKKYQKFGGKKIG